MIISVKKKHIKAGKRNEGCECPIALALVDAGVEPASVYEPAPFVGDACINTAGRVYQLSRSAQRFVRKFDKTGKGKPFKFKINETVTLTDWLDGKKMR